MEGQGARRGWAGHRARNTFVVGGVSLGSAALWVVCRLDSRTWGAAVPLFQGACKRIKESGIPASPGDWWCTSPAWHWKADILLFSLAGAIALALPCAILALQGYRRGALLPLLFVPFGVERSLVVWTGLGFGNWLTDTGGSLPGPLIRYAWVLLVNAALIGAPAVAIMALTRRRDTPWRPSLRSRRLSAAACLVATAVVVWFTWRALHVQLFEFLDIRWWWILVPAAIMGIFGAMQGFRGRSWPFTLALCSVFLSLGPAAIVSTLFRWRPEGEWLVLLTFGGVVPLFIVGLVWSSWFPLARRFDGRRGRPPVLASAKASPIATALAIALLACSAGLFMSDTTEARLASPLPTYLGQRNRANDLRALMNLDMAFGAMDAWHREHGTYRGFDAAAASRIEPALAWSDRQDPDQDALVVAIENAPRQADGYEDVVSVIVRSNSGEAFCATRAWNGDTTYGQAASVRQARAHCTDGAWSPELLDPPPQLACEPRTEAFLICRMVQVLIWNSLHDAKPGLIG